MKKNQDYSSLLKAYYDMAWECEFRNCFGDHVRAIEAAKEMERISKLMYTWPSRNELRVSR